MLTSIINLPNSSLLLWFFNYCADEAEALQTLNQIVKIEGIKMFFCCDEDLQNFLNVTKTNFTTSLDINNDATFITCEF